MNPKTINILENGTKSQIKGIFLFDKNTDPEIIRKQFIVWSRWFFPKFFKEKGTDRSIPDAAFHKKIDEGNINAYLKGGSFLDIAFRGSAKTTRTKLFIAFAIANDEGHYRRYFKVLSKELKNSTQTTTDVYNMLISPRIKDIWPEIFEKTNTKREETMSSFTTATGVKMVADSVGTDQRGDLQENIRPDFIFFDDFETRKSLASAVITHNIWQNMDEAVTGLAKDGAVVYTCNYISERGNVHKLIEDIQNQINIPIEEHGEPTWPELYTKDEIHRIRFGDATHKAAEDYAGDYLGKPSAGKDVYFDRASVERQVAKDPIDEIAGLKIFRPYNPRNRVGSGHDVGGGVGLDSSASVFIDFDCIPAQVIATYKNNEIKPDAFAHEIARQCKRFGENYCGVEKNYGSTIDILKQIYPTSKLHRTYKNDVKIVFQDPTEYGWGTNSATKPKMLSEVNYAIENGRLELNDKDLIAEVRSYTLGDLMDPEVDARLTTRHFDLLMALCIAWQMNPFIKKPAEPPELDAWERRALQIQNAEKENPAI